MIDKHSAIPVYLQIEQVLSDLIARGELKPGDALPSEPALSKQFAVSRETARKAVDYLVRQGRVERQRGRGTFVCAPKSEFKIELSLDKHMPSSELVDGSDSPIANRLLHLSREPASAEIAEALQIQPGDAVFHMVRLRLVDNTPFVYEHSYMVAAPFADLSDADLNASKYAYIEAKGFRIRGSKKQIRAALPPANVRDELGLKRDEPVLHARTVAYFDDDTPFELSDIYYNQQHYDFTLYAQR